MDDRQHGLHSAALQAQLFHAADALPTPRCQQEPSYASPALLRGIISNFFSVPPNLASLFSLSLAISASRPSFTREVFSLMPVSLAALSSNSSSMFSVVLINSSSKICYFICISVHG